MKIGIVTIYDNTNIGNRLQNYALQQTLLHFADSVTTIKNKPYSISWLEKIKIKCNLGESIVLNKALNNLKKAKILQFNRKYLSLSKRCYFYNKEYHNNVEECDYYCVGSDQVWNPELNITGVLHYGGIFSKSKVFSYAASFGIDNISNQDAKVMKSYIENVNPISVRESTGIELVKMISDGDATVLIDPTLMLDKKEWRKVSEKPKKVEEHFVLTYFLSPMSSTAKEKLDEIREDRKVLNLMDHNDPVVGNVGPSEFLWMFDHADIVLTDSFHACVFSFIFDKPFIVFDRNWNRTSMNSRLETFLSKFSIERKYANSGLDNDIWEHDYSEGYKQLVIERKKSINFLKKALED